jgi:hypothetical protein
LDGAKGQDVPKLYAVVFDADNGGKGVVFGIHPIHITFHFESSAFVCVVGNHRITFKASVGVSNSSFLAKHTKVTSLPSSDGESAGGKGDLLPNVSQFDLGYTLYSKFHFASLVIAA